jgi:glycosyltransferase involved in cell wall biosynthesis
MQVIVSVINDLSTDQRVHKTCASLKSMGFEVLLVGRKQRKSLLMAPRNYKTSRISLLFEKGVAFYAFFQWRLWWFLLFHKCDLLVANDLDTLLPNYLVSRIKGIPLVYDTHELFCEVPELQSSPVKRQVWKSIERFIFPKLKDVFTVNESIAKIYTDEYKVVVNVVRNLPLKSAHEAGTSLPSRKTLGLPEDKKIILLQGAGINVDRGGEEAVMAMNYVTGAVLLIIGSGDVVPKLKVMSADPVLEGKVLFIPRLPFEQLQQYTRLADIGLTLDKNTNMNYRLSLPNKIFDYIHAGVPVFASDLVEVRKIVDTYKVGCVTPNLNPETIGGLLTEVLRDTTRLHTWKENTQIAAEVLCWEQEEEVLKKVYTKYLK